MKMLTFWPGKYITSEQKIEHLNSLNYLMETNKKGEYFRGSLGLRSIILFLLKQEDIYRIDTEVSFCPDNKRLKSDIAIYFTNRSKGVIEFNGTQHFIWSSWYPDKKSFTKQNESLIYKELTCLKAGYSCLNINDLSYTDTPLEDYDENSPYNLDRKKIQYRYMTFFQEMRKGNCYQLRKALNAMKTSISIFNYNIKLRDRDWRNGFRNSSSKELDKIIFNLCNDDNFNTFI